MTLVSPFKISRRLRWILAIGGVAVVAVLLFINYRFYLPVGTGPAGPPVAAEPFEQPWSERKVVLVAMGDSVTFGQCASKGKSYVERLADNPPDEFEDMQGRSLRRVLPNLQVKNVAVSGSNSLQHVGYVKELEKQPKDVFGIVVMTCSGNDLIHWYGRKPPREGAMYGATPQQAQPWIANYKTRLNGLLTDIEKKFPGGCLIFLADIYDPSDGVGDPETTWALPAWPDALPILAAYNQTIRDVAATHPKSVRVVPMHDTFLGHGIHCRQWWRQNYCRSDPTFWYGDIVEDPNDRGYDALRRVFLNEIIKERERLSAE